MKEIEQADEPAWMAYTMSQLAMAMANGILFDSKDVINGASCILERLDELEWNRQQPPDPYPNRVRDEALQFMERVHQRIQNWFEQHKPIQCAYVEVEGEIVAYSDDLFYWDCDGQYHRSPEPTEDIEVSRLIREGKELSRSVFCPRLVCNDGFTMSVQASHGHYCSDRDSSATHWSSVEVGFPSEREELLLPHKEGFLDLDGEATKMVYPYTPCDVVAQVIAKHGGFKSYAVGAQHIGTYADPDQWIEDI
jgi:hypothetical protein